MSLERLEQILPAAYDNYQLLVLALQLMVNHRIETLEQLNYVANKLDERHRKGNIAKLVGSLAGMAGSGIAATGVVLSTVTVGAATPVIAGGVALAFIGSGTAFGAHLTEKVMEKVDVEKVQEAIDRDRAQCERVKELWKEFDSYCIDAINTIALADPREESDIASLQTWVQVAMEEIKSPIKFLAETFHKVHSEAEKKLCTPEGQELCALLAKEARKMIGDPVTAFKSIVSRACQSVVTVFGTISFVLLAGIAIGNLFVFLITVIDMHNGSPSKVAKELRKSSEKLRQELDKWLDAFGHTRR